MALPDFVIIDTSAFYALASPADEFHDAAVATYQALIDREQGLRTTSYVLLETIALMERRLGFDVLKALLDSIRGVVQTFWIEDGLHNAAWDLFEEKRGSGPSFVDWTTILVARRMAGHVFTFDSDFLRENITVLPRSP